MIGKYGIRATLRAWISGSGPIETAIMEMYDEHVHYVWKTVAQKVPRDDVEAVVQGTFSSAYKWMKKKDTIPDNRRGLLKKVSRFEVTAYFRERGGGPEVVDGVEVEEVPASTRTPEQDRADAQRRERLHDALERMEADDRTILDLVWFKGKSVVEAAGDLRISLAAAKARHWRAMQKLKKMLLAGKANVGGDR